MSAVRAARVSSARRSAGWEMWRAGAEDEAALHAEGVRCSGRAAAAREKE